MTRTGACVMATQAPAFALHSATRGFTVLPSTPPALQRCGPR